MNYQIKEFILSGSRAFTMKNFLWSLSVLILIIPAKYADAAK